MDFASHFGGNRDTRHASKMICSMRVSLLDRRWLTAKDYRLERIGGRWPGNHGPLATNSLRSKDSAHVVLALQPSEA